MSLQVLSEDHYTTTEYGAGPHMLDKNKVGTRYALIGIRTLIERHAAYRPALAQSSRPALSLVMSAFGWRLSWSLRPPWRALRT